MSSSNIRERRQGLLSREQLLSLSYRQLQQIAKGWSIPCNIKKVHLQEALYRSYHGTQQQVQDVLDRVARERNLQKRMSIQKAKAKISHQCWTDKVKRMFFDQNLTIQTVVGQKGPVRKAVKRKIIYKYAPTRSARREETEKVATNKNETTRILRNTAYPIYNKLGKKKTPRRDPNELLVTSSADVIATRSMVQKLLHGDQEYSRLSYTKYNAAPNVEYKIHHEYNEPVDFSVKYQTPDTNYATRGTIESFRPNRPFPLMYRQITLTERYKNCQSNYRNGQQDYQNDSSYPDCQTSYKTGQSSFQNGQSSYENGQLSYRNNQSTLQNGQPSYENQLSHNGQSSYQNGESSYQNGESSYQNGESSYQNGESSYQNEESSYQNGQSNFENGQLSYQNDQSSYQDCHSSCQNNQYNETHTDANHNALMPCTQVSDNTQNRDFYSPNQQYLCAQNLYALRYSNQEQIQFTNIQSSNQDSCDAATNFENDTFENSDKTVYFKTNDPTSKYYHKKIRIERRVSEQKDQHGYATPDRDANDIVQYSNQETVVPNYIANNPDSTVSDGATGTERAKTYEDLSIVNPEIHVNTTYTMYVDKIGGPTDGITEFSNSLPSISGIFPKYSKSTQTSISPQCVEVDCESDISVGREDVAVQTEDVICVEPPIKRYEDTAMKITLTADDSSELKEEFKPPPLSRHLQAMLQESHDVEAIIDLDTIASRVNSPWSDVGASVTVRAHSPSWDDVMGLITQDGFQEYVSAHVDNVQCVCCTWNGERPLLEQHLRQEHIDEIMIHKAQLTFKYSMSLGELMREKRRAVLIRWYNKYHVLLIKYDDPEWVSATVALMSPHGDSPMLQSTVTVYNKLTGEPYKWDGPILTSNLIFHSNPTAHLKLQLSKLGLDPNIGQLLLWNGQADSREDETGCGSGGNKVLDEINIDFHIELND